MKNLKFLLLIPILAGAGCTEFTKPTCEYAGQLYSAEETFQSIDDCNTCRCKPDGEVICTEKACQENNPAQCETAQDCQSIDDIDMSFCDDGQWSCLDSTCEFTCDIGEI